MKNSKLFFLLLTTASLCGCKVSSNGKDPAPETAGQKEVSYEDFKEESKKYTPKHHTKAVLKTTTQGGNGSVNETFALEIQEVDMHPYVEQKIKRFSITHNSESPEGGCNDIVSGFAMCLDVENAIFYFDIMKDSYGDGLKFYINPFECSFPSGGGGSSDGQSYSTSLRENDIFDNDLCLKGIKVDYQKTINGEVVSHLMVIGEIQYLD